MTVSDALDARFRAAAGEAGLLDVAFDTQDSPVGELVIAVSEAGVCSIAFSDEPEEELERLARSFGARVLRSPRPVDPVRRELEEYFAGRRQAFDVPVDLRPLPDFQRRVLEELATVAYGSLETYGGLASRIERPRAARAVGRALNRNPVPIVLPCHRVVGASGDLVGYGGGLERKRTLLALEGVSLPIV
jgi:methylated-DNA-[protein]-cysteine S-methyltransferase